MRSMSQPPVWRAQQEGIIARDERPAAIKALLGYQKAVQRLGVFRDRLSVALDGGTAPVVSMVLIETMLWVRYKPARTTLDMIPHADGPTNGDVVIVTDEQVVAALNEGRVTPQAARELGLLRLYGSSGAVEDVTAWLDRLSSQRTNAGAAEVGN
jgi:hypothetical protein